MPAAFSSALFFYRTTRPPSSSGLPQASKLSQAQQGDLRGPLLLEHSTQNQCKLLPSRIENNIASFPAGVSEDD